jgi:uncharacterized protein YaiI (UPF0178 family)
MHIWVDADACPAVIKEILFRAAQRTGISTTLVANQPLRVPPDPHITSIRVEAGPDVADHEIVRRCDAGDLVITADLPLAAEVIALGAQALSPRGELFSTENIRARVNMRDFMETLRASGIQTDGPAPLSQSDRREFAQHLDKLLARIQRTPS